MAVKGIADVDMVTCKKGPIKFISASSPVISISLLFECHPMYENIFGRRRKLVGPFPVFGKFISCPIAWKPEVDITEEPFGVGSIYRLFSGTRFRWASEINCTLCMKHNPYCRISPTSKRMWSHLLRTDFLIAHSYLPPRWFSYDFFVSFFLIYSTAVLL